MAQPITPDDKTVRIPVKLVTMAGDELPFKGFMLVPEDRLVLLEKLATAANALMSRREEALADVNRFAMIEPALKALGDRVSELEKVWDIPLK
jgi:hypothetical protein